MNDGFANFSTLVGTSQFTSPHVGLSSRAVILGDFDGNGAVDFDDFFPFADAFGGTNPTYDLDDSGKVVFADFFIFADNFGRKY